MKNDLKFSSVIYSISFFLLIFIFSCSDESQKSDKNEIATLNESSGKQIIESEILEPEIVVEYFKINDPDGYSNLRDAPKGEVLQKVYDTEKFEVIGTEGDYKQVKLSSGTTGYIHKSMIVSFSENAIDEDVLDIPDNNNCNSCVKEIVSKFLSAAISLDASEMKKYITNCSVNYKDCNKLESYANKYSFKEFDMPQYLRSSKNSSMNKLKSDKYYIEFYSDEFVVAVVPAISRNGKLPNSVKTIYLIFEEGWKVIGFGRSEDEELIRKSVL
jgi:hypothetical protein